MAEHTVERAVGTTGIVELTTHCSRLAALHATVAEGIGAWFVGVEAHDTGAVATWAAMARDHGRMADAWSDRIPAIDAHRSVGDDDDHDDHDDDATEVRARIDAATSTDDRARVLAEDLHATVVDALAAIEVDPRLDAPTAALIRDTLAVLDRHRAQLTRSV